MTINILSNGLVEYAGERDGQRWRTTIIPGDMATAAALLDANERAQVEAAWTPEVIAAWQAKMEAEIEWPVDVGQHLPTPSEQIEELQAAIIELATIGKLSTARLEKLVNRGLRQDLDDIT